MGSRGGGDGGGWGGDYGGDDDYDYDTGSSSKNVCAIAYNVCAIAYITVFAGLIAHFSLPTGIRGRNWPEVAGEIVAIKECSGKGNTTYGAIISYEVDGIEYTIEGLSCTAWKPTIGKEIKIVYDPEDPQYGFNPREALLVPIIAITVSALSFVVLSYRLYKKLKYRRRRTPTPYTSAGIEGASFPSLPPPCSHEPPTSTYYDDEKPQTATSAPPPVSVYSYGQSPSTVENFTPPNTTNTTSNQNITPGNGKSSLFDQIKSGL